MQPQAAHENITFTINTLYIFKCAFHIEKKYYFVTTFLSLYNLEKFEEKEEPRNRDFRFIRINI